VKNSTFISTGTTQFRWGNHPASCSERRFARAHPPSVRSISDNIRPISFGTEISQPGPSRYGQLLWLPVCEDAERPYLHGQIPFAATEGLAHRYQPRGSQAVDRLDKEPDASRHADLVCGVTGPLGVVLAKVTRIDRHTTEHLHLDSLFRSPRCSHFLIQHIAAYLLNLDNPTFRMVDISLLHMELVICYPIGYPWTRHSLSLGQAEASNVVRRLPVTVPRMIASGDRETAWVADKLTYIKIL
jgi:hypothetical protein